jgi:hypothetical protein
VFAVSDAEQFQTCFVNWIQAVERVTEGQVKVDDKSNEIPAVPELLEILENEFAR